MALNTDIFFIQTLQKDKKVMATTQGRIFDTARPEIDEEEDKVPYIIISFDGFQNQIESKDDVGESGVDNDTISVLIVTSEREQLAILAKLVRAAIKKAFIEFGEKEEKELGFEFYDYTLNGGAVEFDFTKPCVYQTLTYNCETKTI